MITDKKELTLALRGDHEIVFTRVFDAPREMVYDCHTKPELLKRWLTGPEGWSFATCDMDLKVGGKYLYVWEHPERSKFGMHGSYREIVRPERVVNTESFIPDMTAFDPNAGEDANAAAVNTLVFTPQGDATLMTLVCRYPSAEIRKMVMQTGMETGMQSSYERLDALMKEAA